MAAIYLAPFYLLVCVYILLRSLHWFQVLHTVFQNVWVCRGIGLVYLFVMFSILIAFMAPASGFRRFMKLLSNYWLGVLMYTLMTLGIADGLRLLLKYPLRNFAFPGRELLFSNMGTAVVGAVCAVIISTVSIYGVLSAGNIHTTKYNISVDKKAGNMKELNVVLVADLHLGYNIGCKQMEQMTEKINEQKPDLVVVAGDIFDNEYEALDNPDRLAEILRGIHSKYGVYACYGNHDIQEKILATDGEVPDYYRVVEAFAFHFDSRIFTGKLIFLFQVNHDFTTAFLYIGNVEIIQGTFGKKETVTVSFHNR